MGDNTDEHMLNLNIGDEELKLDAGGENHQYDMESDVSSDSFRKSKSESPNTPKPSKSNHQYDYMTKLNYLFRNTRFFIIKSNNEENILLSKARGVWSTLPANESKLNQAFDECRNVLLIFSVRESGEFTGFARLCGRSRRDVSPVPWVLPLGFNPRNLSGVFYIDWICRQPLPFMVTTHLLNEWNAMKPVKIGRDGQEVEPKTAEALLRLFPEDIDIDMTPILRKSKAAARKGNNAPQEEQRRRPRSSPPRRPRQGYREEMPRSRFRLPPINGSGRNDMSRIRSAEEIAYMHGLPPLSFGPPGMFPPVGFPLDFLPPPVHARYYDMGLPPPSPPLPTRTYLEGHEKRKYDRSVDAFLQRLSRRSRSISQERQIGRDRGRPREAVRERERSRDRQKHPVSRSNRDSNYHRDRDRDNTNYRDRDRDNTNYRDRDRDNSNYRDRDRDRDRYDRNRNRSGRKSRSRSYDRNRRYHR